MAKVRAILAMDPNGVIGIDGDMPWRYKADFARFKKITMGGTLVMGRLTWESLPKPLPGRRMVVVSRQDKPTSKHPEGSCEYYKSFEDAMSAAVSTWDYTSDCCRTCKLFGCTCTALPDVWIAGGGEVYRIALGEHKDGIDEIDLTLVPTVSGELLQKGTTITRFDTNLLDGFRKVRETINEEDPRLIHRSYERL